MPTLYDAQTGEAVSIADGEVQGALASGKYGLAEGQTVRLKGLDSDGNVTIYEADAARAAEELAGGQYQMATDQDVGDYQSAHKDQLWEAYKADVAAKARGATFGLSDHVGAALGAKDELARLKRDNPLVSAAGEMQGALGAALLPGTGVAGALGAPTRAVLKAGSKAEQLTQTLLGAGRTGKVLGGLARGSVEGAAYAAGQQVSEAALGDRELKADQVMAAIGHGALMGGVIGGGASGLGALFARRAAGTAADTATDAYRVASRDIEAIAERHLGVPPAKGLGDQLNETLSKLSAGASGADDAAIRKFGPFNLSKAARNKRAALMAADETLDGASRQLTADIDDVVKSARAITDEVVDSGLKRSNVVKQLGDDAERQIGAAKAEFANIRRDIAEMAGQVDRYGNKKLVKDFAQLVDNLEPRWGKGGSLRDEAADAFIALDKAKRAQQRWAKSLSRSSQRSGNALRVQQSQALAQRFEQSSERGRQLLMADDLWGGAGVAQREINAAWERFFETNRRFSRDFLTDSGRDSGLTGFREYIAAPSKIDSYVRNMTSVQKDLAHQTLRQHVEARAGLVEAIGKHADLPESKLAELAKVAESTKRIQKTVADSEELLELVNQHQAMLKAEGDGLGALTGGILGGATAGPVGAAAGLLAQAVSRPGHATRQLARIEAVTRSWSGKRNAAIRGFVERYQPKPKAITKGGGIAPPTKKLKAPVAGATSTAFADQKKGETQRKAFERRATEIAEFVANPAKATNMLAESTEGAAEVAPEFTAALQTRAVVAANFLYDKLPTGALQPNGPAGDRRAFVTDTEIATFARYWTTVENPLSALRDLSRGRLSAEQVEVLREVYPSEYAQIQVTALEMLGDSKAKLPYRGRVQLDLLLGLDGAGDPSLAPNALLQTAQRAASYREQAEQQPAPSAARPPRISGAYQTKLGEIAGGI